jgi:acetyl-CoA C-acetyltransferase
VTTYPIEISDERERLNVMPEKIAILGGNRIPFARSNGPYAEASNQDMLTAALDGLVARFGLQGERAGEVVAGAVLKHSRDFNLARECVLGSALDNATPAYDLQQACDTGLQAALAVGSKIALGQIEWGIAGGVDTTSDAPLAINEDLRRLLMRARTSSVGGRIRLLGHLRPGQIVPEIPRNAEPRTGMSMGEHQAITTERFGIGREEQDELTVASRQGLAAAYERGFFDDLVTPFLGLERDQNLRPDSSTDKLAKLKPVFGDTMTAANSTPLSDGAAVVLLSSDAWAKQRDIPVLAHLTAWETAAVDYLYGQDGLLMAPVDAIERLLERTGLTVGDFDLYEIHEAFAAQVLCTLRAVGEIDRSKLNVAGGSLAAGHPFAATGGRILATVAKLLTERGSGRALVSICAAGGQGVVAIVEREA